MERIGDGLKKLLLAGIGAAALTGEKAQDLVDVSASAVNTARSKAF